MKKIKLMLVAFMAMLGVTAFATETPWATTTYKYTVDGTTVTITGFVTGYATDQMATVTIPNKLPNPADETKEVEVTAIASKAFEKNANIKKVVIEATKLVTLNNAFSGCANLAEIDLSKATGITTIDEGAFVGTKLAKLDLSKTKITTVPALFGTSFVKVEAKDAVLWKDTETTEIAAHNADGTKVVQADLATAGTVGTTKAPLYNATLTGAVKTTDKVADAAFVTEYNATLNPLEAGQDLTAAQATAVNTALSLSPGYATDGSAVLKKVDAEAYNAKLGLIEVGKVYTDAAAAYYNGKLTGAIASDWTFIASGDPAAKQILCETYNRAVVENYAYVGGVKTPAVKGVDPIAYASLTEVTLPETWTKIATKAFLNCSALATINFGTAKADQEIETKAFLGTALTALDFTNTKVTTLPTALLIDGTDVKKNETLKTVTLSKAINNLQKNFAFCTALETIDLTNITAIAANEFEGAGLKSITIPAEYTSIPAGAFKDCTSLATVTFAKPAEGKTWTFTSIGVNAFANTALTEFTVPNVIPYTVASSSSTGVADNAFADCSKLKSFTYKPDVKSGTVLKVVSDKVFLGCEDGITFYTVKEYAEAAALLVAGKPVAPSHSTFSYESSPSSDPSEAKELKASAFKQTSKAGMYFVKYNYKNSTKQNIKIAKADAKVYAAYNDDSDGSIIMQAFKPSGGYYHIAAGDNVLILSNSEKIPYETTSIVGGSTIETDGSVLPANAGKGTSWLANAAFTTPENMLKYVSEEAGVKRSALEDVLPAGFSIYAWANTTAFTGWKKITSGSTFPQNTLYIFAKPAADAEGVRVIWLDENGNIEDETTAIQGIESVEEAGNGASYNLAGQKVNAAYKGVVIKDGKKYMMK